jgi:hypothetical protein
MKTRTSLVSNSSSSSFICDVPIKKIALQMWDVVRSDFSESADDIGFTGVKDRISQLADREDVQTGRVGICFPSMNYDTYILVVDGKCLINTSNNHNWRDIDCIGHEVDESANTSLIENAFFYYAIIPGELYRIGAKIQYLEHSDYVCPTCQEYWGSQKQTRCNSYYEGDDGSKFCSEHLVKLVDVKQKEQTI